MSADGPISAYVNAFGHVHETLTLARARGLSLAGQPQTTANSWFPGLATLSLLWFHFLFLGLGCERRACQLFIVIGSVIKIDLELNRRNGREIAVLHTTPSMFAKFLLHAWRECLNLNEERSILGH